MNPILRTSAVFACLLTLLVSACSDLTTQPQVRNAVMQHQGGARFSGGWCIESSCASEPPCDPWYDANWCQPPGGRDPCMSSAPLHSPLGTVAPMGCGEPRGPISGGGGNPGDTGTPPEGNYPPPDAYTEEPNDDDGWIDFVICLAVKALNLDPALSAKRAEYVVARDEYNLLLAIKKSLYSKLGPNASRLIWEEYYRVSDELDEARRQLDAARSPYLRNLASAVADCAKAPGGS